MPLDSGPPDQQLHILWETFPTGGRHSHGHQGCSELCDQLYALLGKEIRLLRVWRPVPLEMVHRRHLPDLTNWKRYFGRLYPILE